MNTTEKTAIQTKIVNALQSGPPSRGHVDSSRVCLEDIRTTAHLAPVLETAYLLHQLVGLKITDVVWMNVLDAVANPDGNLGFFRISVSK